MNRPSRQVQKLGFLPQLKLTLLSPPPSQLLQQLNPLLFLPPYQSFPILHFTLPCEYSSTLLLFIPVFLFLPSSAASFSSFTLHSSLLPPFSLLISWLLLSSQHHLSLLLTPPCRSTAVTPTTFNNNTPITTSSKWPSRELTRNSVISEGMIFLLILLRKSASLASRVRGVARLSAESYCLLLIWHLELTVYL